MAHDLTPPLTSRARLLSSLPTLSAPRSPPRCIVWRAAGSDGCKRRYVDKGTDTGEDVVLSPAQDLQFRAVGNFTGAERTVSPARLENPHIDPLPVEDPSASWKFADFLIKQCQVARVQSSSKQDDKDILHDSPETQEDDHQKLDRALRQRSADDLLHLVQARQVDSNLCRMLDLIVQRLEFESKTQQLFRDVASGRRIYQLLYPIIQRYRNDETYIKAFLDRHVTLRTGLDAAQRQREATWQDVSHFVSLVERPTVYKRWLESTLFCYEQACDSSLQALWQSIIDLPPLLTTSDTASCHALAKFASHLISDECDSLSFLAQSPSPRKPLVVFNGPHNGIGYLERPVRSRADLVLWDGTDPLQKRQGQAFRGLWTEPYLPDTVVEGPLTTREIFLQPLLRHFHQSGDLCFILDGDSIPFRARTLFGNAGDGLLGEIFGHLEGLIRCFELAGHFPYLDVTFRVLEMTKRHVEPMRPDLTPEHLRPQSKRKGLTVFEAYTLIAKGCEEEMWDTGTRHVVIDICLTVRLVGLGTRMLSTTIILLAGAEVPWRHRLRSEARDAPEPTLLTARTTDPPDHGTPSHKWITSERKALLEFLRFQAGAEVPVSKLTTYIRPFITEKTTVSFLLHLSAAPRRAILTLELLNMYAAAKYCESFNTESIVD